MARLRFHLLLLAGCLCMASAAAGVGWWYLTSPVQPERETIVDIAPGSSLTRVAADLQQRQIVRQALVLRILARWHGQEQQIQAGRYRFSASATPAQVLDRLVRGDVIKVSLTIPEGFTLRQIARRIDEAGFGSEDALLKLAYDADFIASLNIDAASLEGYLFPETYSFVQEISEGALLRMMVEQFQQRLTDDLREAAGSLDLSLHEHVTLASLIEKETGLVEEMPLISSVFHNRLIANMRLQTDPTAVYDLEDFSGTVTRAHLANPSPYNTYLIRGLPPGPIASPGLAALTAAVFPAQTDYYYFVSRKDGSHHFSRNLREHNQAIQRYLRNRR